MQVMEKAEHRPDDGDRGKYCDKAQDDAGIESVDDGQHECECNE